MNSKSVSSVLHTQKTQIHEGKGTGDVQMTNLGLANIPTGRGFSPAWSQGGALGALCFSKI